ncbi:MAG: response regulator [Desulfococcaceae bacterium]
MGDRKYRILVVDDEPNNLQLMRQILSPHYQMAFAASGPKSLDIVKTLETDLILLDIMMPGMDGYEVCERLRNDEKTKHIPVIFVTAKDDVDDEVRGLELGAIDYITKPVSPSIVKARVKNQLELKSALEKIEKQNQRLEKQNMELKDAAVLREDVERITRHDLKTPLNAIIGVPRIMMMDRNLPEKYKNFLKMIEDAGLTMLSMINFSLDLFKMERGIYRFRPAAVDISGIIAKILAELRELESSRNLYPELLVNGKICKNPDSFTAQGEELLCYSMLSNLIRNAFEASPEGERIRIELAREKDYAVIRIHNKGAVPPEIRDRFFDKYVTSGKKSGTGLGTYSARLIALTQGGSIDMDTSEEKGTILTVRLLMVNDK